MSQPAWKPGPVTPDGSLSWRPSRDICEAHGRPLNAARPPFHSAHLLGSRGIADQFIGASHSAKSAAIEISARDLCGIIYDLDAKPSYFFEELAQPHDHVVVRQVG